MDYNHAAGWGIYESKTIETEEHKLNDVYYIWAFSYQSIDTEI